MATNGETHLRLPLSRLRQHRMNERENSDQQHNRADPNDRANGASSEASPYWLDKTFNWIAEHSFTPLRTGKPASTLCVQTRRPAAMIWIKESAVKLGALTMLPRVMGDSVCIGADYHVTWSPPSPHSPDHAGIAAPPP